jgi:protein-tyrosine phosphatase
LELFWVEGPFAGRLAVATRPRGGDWLDDEAQTAYPRGVDVVVSALTPDEEAAFDLAGAPGAFRGAGSEFVSLPVVDRDVPGVAVVESLTLLTRRLEEGRVVAVYCRQGLGRSPLVAASLLTLAGVDPEVAWERVQRARGRIVPDTKAQREWVLDLPRRTANGRGLA